MPEPLELTVPSYSTAYLRNAVDTSAIPVLADGKCSMYPRRDERITRAAEEIALSVGLYFQSLFVYACDKYSGERKNNEDAQYLNTHPYDGSMEWVQRALSTDRDYRRTHKNSPFEYYNTIFGLESIDYFWCVSCA